MSDTVLLWLVMIVLTPLAPFLVAWKASSLVRAARDLQGRLRIYNLFIRVSWIAGAALVVTSRFIREEGDAATALVAGFFLLGLAASFWYFRRPDMRAYQASRDESSLQ